MFTTGVRWIGLAAVLVCGVSPAWATPITYAFSGTLDQPYNGSSQFSGTFTYDTDLPLNPNVQPYPGWSYYSGVPVDPSEPPLSLTFNLGNTPSSSFGTLQSSEMIVTHTQGGYDGFYIEEQLQSNSSSGGGQSVFANIGMVNDNSIQNGPFTSTNPPLSLNLASFSMGAQLDITISPSNGQGATYVGTITALVETPAPEPASLLVFGILGAGLWRKHRRASQGWKGRDRTAPAR
jgi:PEP-CTERM motif